MNKNIGGSINKGLIIKNEKLMNNVKDTNKVVLSEYEREVIIKTLKVE